MRDFRQKIAVAETSYLEAGTGGADERLDQIVYGRFLEPEARKAFFEAYKDLETLWEILSPSAELRDHIATFTRLTHLYAAVRQAYAQQVGFIADLAYKTRRLIESNAIQEGLGRLTRSVTFDVKTLDSLRDEPGSDEGKVFNLVRGLHKEIDDDPNAAPILQPLRERAERILKDLESRKISGLAAMDLIAALAAEKDDAMKSAEESGLSKRAFAVSWTLRDDAALKKAGISHEAVAREAETLLARFPNAAVNVDEQRRLRAGLYRPLLALEKDDRSRIVDLAVATLLGE
jgi:type I restriction enzyme R subunit